MSISTLKFNECVLEVCQTHSSVLSVISILLFFFTSSMDSMPVYSEDAECKTQVGVEGLMCVLYLRFGGSCAAMGQRRASLSNCLPPTTSFLPVFFFLSPHNSHSFLAASAVAQLCDTSLASIIPGSDEPIGRGKK